MLVLYLLLCMLQIRPRPIKISPFFEGYLFIFTFPTRTLKDCNFLLRQKNGGNVHFRDKGNLWHA